MTWIGQAVYALLYYVMVAVAATVVYGARGTKAAAPHVSKAARWTGRNTQAGAQKLQARMRKQKSEAQKSETQPAGAERVTREYSDGIVHLDQWSLYNINPPPGTPPEAIESGLRQRDAARPPSTSSGPAAGSGLGSSSSTRSGGSGMSKRNGNGQGGNGNGVSDVELFRRIKQAFRPVGQLEPETAWELDWHFQAYADTLLFEAEMLSLYGETLDRQVGIDPRLNRQYLEAVEDVTSAVQKLHRVRRAYRQMYKAAFEAAESGRVRMPSKPNFWSSKR